MKKHTLQKLLFTLLIIGVSQVNAWAQCAMCRATVENNARDGDTVLAAGLNTGILYLFLAPYLLMGVLAWFWYCHSKSLESAKIFLGHVYIYALYLLCPFGWYCLWCWAFTFLIS